MDNHEREPCPMARNGHAAVCLDYGGDHPQLLVTGGKGVGNKILSDGWMLDVQSGRWRKVRVYACRFDGVVCSAIPLASYPDRPLGPLPKKISKGKAW